MKLEHWPMIEAVFNLDRDFIAKSFEEFYPDDRIRDIVYNTEPVIEHSLLTGDDIVELALQSPSVDTRSEYRGYIVLRFSLKYGMMKSIGVFRVRKDRWSINSKYRSTA